MPEKAYVPAVTIGNHTVRSVGVKLAAESSGRLTEGSPGSDILSRFIALLDLRRQRLAHLPRAKGIAHPPIKGVTGMSIEKTQGASLHHGTFGVVSRKPYISSAG